MVAWLTNLLVLGLLLISELTYAADPLVWDNIRASLFQDRRIEVDSGTIIRLDAPNRAEDAAVVPISIRTGIPENSNLHIVKTWLIIDQNPSPIAATFTFLSGNNPADIETRVRVNEYTLIHAVAELNDGSLHMASKFVKASGGCSAPAGKDATEINKSLGKIKLYVEKPTIIGKPMLAQLMISHPNDSGLAFDQLSRNYAPSHYIREISISYNDIPILTADVDISISENPNFRFYFTPTSSGNLTAEVVDSQNLHFNAVTKLDL
jgi:sulfur-oxidizing protein SoxY